ncbi:hypothetical protein SAMN05421740_103334 [Parapedobacter koreensis]|uniref:Uncharacterized protein n=1 Tax=Parapedobacter koreensis TaxID=332977 RepID=A0A1H7M1X8_9SPHI|nr:hypothetical protein SAMN05421740_103334 [Parapedobacter koreensis]
MYINDKDKKNRAFGKRGKNKMFFINLNLNHLT